MLPSAPTDMVGWVLTTLALPGGPHGEHTLFIGYAAECSEPTCQVVRPAPPPNPGVDDGGPDQLEDRESGGMGALCGQSSAIGAKDRAALSPWA